MRYTNISTLLTDYTRRLKSFSLLFVLLCLTAGVTEAQDMEGVTPYDISKLEQVLEVAISPDGETMAYTVYKQADPQKENAYAYRELYVAEAGSDAEGEPYITGDVRVRDIAFTPDGKHITFRANRESVDHTSLFAIPVDGGEARKALEFRSTIYDYDWHPTEDKVVFTAKEEGVPGERSDVPYHAEVYEEGEPNRKAYVADAFQSTDEAKELSVEGTVYQVKWSPSGDRIALSRAPTPFTDDYYMRQRVRVVDAESGEVEAEIHNPGKLGEIAWSPDGQRLAMISGIDIHDPIDGRLAIADAQGGEPEFLMEDYEGKIEDIAWTDNETIRYLASEGAQQTLAEISYEGSGKETLIQPGGPAYGSFSMDSGAQSMILTASTPAHPTEAYYMKNRGSEPARITHLNSWLDDVALGRQEVIEYEAADGLTLEGLLIYPVGYEEGEEYPLITVVHGGPEAHYDNAWLTRYSDPGQMAAAMGMAVFYPNYRGSTGRGVEFLKSSQGDPAGKEFDDVVDGVDYLIEQGIADEDKIAVTGGSYGGYATGWMATRYSDRFAAGVMFVGISDKISKVGTTDIPDEELLVHARKRPWEDWQFFLERSPIYHAGKNETPLLIMHGKEDPRVNPGQSREMYRHLKIRTEVPVRLVFYPGEGHGNGKATARIDYNMRSLRWLKYYLENDKNAEKPSYKIDITDKEAYIPE